jgi:hypothetical protein
MDIMILPGDALRVKGKNSTLVLNPTAGTTKTEADGVILLDKFLKFNDSKIEGSRIKIIGPGDYEVGGAKITAISVFEKLAVRIDIDNVKVLIGNGEAIEKIQDKVEDSDILVVNADMKFNYSTLASLEPKVLMVYGELREEVSKSLGKESAEKMNKYSVTKDKLPPELQFILLG